MNKPYKRILLKLSGEVLGGEKGFGIDEAITRRVGRVIASLAQEGIQPGIVIGGGNFWRGRTGGSMNAADADTIGMLATVMNVLAMRDVLRGLGVRAHVQSALYMPQVADPIDPQKAIEALESGAVVLFGGGTGNPFFTTDTGALLRGAQIEADIVLKASNVDGVYDKDPKKYKDAHRYETISPAAVLREGLGVIDATAAALCGEQKLPILVFDMTDPGNIRRAAHGEAVGTRIAAP